VRRYAGFTEVSGHSGHRMGRQASPANATAESIAGPPTGDARLVLRPTPGGGANTSWKCDNEGTKPPEESKHEPNDVHTRIETGRGSTPGRPREERGSSAVDAGESPVGRGWDPSPPPSRV